MRSLRDMLITEGALPVSYVVKKFNEFVAEFTRTNFCKKDKSLQNKTDLKMIFASFLKWTKDKFGGNTNEILRKVECDTAAGFVKYVYDNAEGIDSQNGMLDKFKDFQLSKTEVEYKKYKKEHEEEFEAVDDENAEERDLVIYDRYDPATHKIYGFHGKRGKATDHQVNMFRVDFHYETGTKYYNCYSCLYSYYIEHKKDLEHYVDYIGEND